MIRAILSFVVAAILLMVGIFFVNTENNWPILAFAMSGFFAFLGYFTYEKFLENKAFHSIVRYRW